MSSLSSHYFGEDFEERSRSKLPKKSLSGKMSGVNSQTFFPSESEEDLSSESHSDKDTDGGESEDPQDNYNEMTMEELIKLQEDMGTKKFKQKVLGVSGRPTSIVKEETSTEQKLKHKQLKRANKNRPSEVPMMRRAAPRMFSLVPRQKIKKQGTRDPRFDDLSGSLNLKVWKGNFSFLKDKRKEEKEILKKEMESEQDRFKKQKIKSIIQRMENQERERARQDREMEIRQMDRQQQMDALRQGKKPRFMTKKEQKLALKAAHFEELKKENRVEKYLERKEKHKLVKELRNQRNM